MEENYKIYEAMQEDKPLAIFRKTILGKVAVSVLNPIFDRPEIVLLQGKVDKNNRECYVSIFTTKELVFFERVNRRLIEIGHIIRDDNFIKQEETKNEKPFEQYTDEELSELLNKQYAYFIKVLSKINNPVVVHRLLEIAQNENKPSKLINTLQTKIAELEGKPVEEQ